MIKQLTVAIPVFNGATYLDEALAGVLADKSVGLSVNVYDNASTDRSYEIAVSWAAKDSRVHVLRHSENIGALPNFVYSAASVDTPYFAWRAYDDLSSADYFGRMKTVLESTPHAILAIPSCRTTKLGKKDRIETVHSGMLPIRKAIEDAHPSWLYGVWRTSAAQDAVRWASQNAPSLWGWDHLALLSAALCGPFVGCPTAWFTRRVTKGPTKATAGLAAEKQKLRQEILAAGQRLILSRDMPDRELYLALWEKLVEKRIIRREVRTFRDLLARFGSSRCAQALR